MVYDAVVEGSGVPVITSAAVPVRLNVLVVPVGELLCWPKSRQSLLPIPSIFSVQVGELAPCTKFKPL